jgi:hypothetical protein
MSYGHRNALAIDSAHDNRRSARHVDLVRSPGGAIVVVKGLPPSRNAGGAMVGYSPSRRGNVGVGARGGVGVAGCGGDEPGPGPNGRPGGNSGVFCSNVQDAGPIPAGGGDVVVPKRVAAVNGTILYQIIVTEPFRIENLFATDPTGLIQTDSVSTGRNGELLESGAVRLERFNSNNTMCKLAKGIDIWPGKPLTISLINSSLADVTVNIGVDGWPQICPPRQQ